MTRSNGTLAPGRALRLAHGLALGLALGLSAPLPSLADDTEIFFGRSDDAFESNPNILFVLDTSGSMSETDGDTSTRMERLKRAMGQVLDQSSSFNVGLMGFQGYGGGGAVRYPVGYLESDSGELCDDGICPDEVVVTRPGGRRDDATENDASGDIRLHPRTLGMGRIDEGVTEESPLSEGVTARTRAVADAHEYTSYDGERVQRTTGSENEWFRSGDRDDDGAALYAYRFEGVDIPPDATVTSATILFTHTGPGRQKGALDARIAAEQTANPEPLSSDALAALPLVQRNDPTLRTRALVAWNDVPPPWPAPRPGEPAADTTRLGTPDLGSILTELASLPDWSAGGAVSILLSPSDSYLPSVKDRRELHGSDATLERRPELVYTYSLAVDPNVGNVERTASAHRDEFVELASGAIASNLGNAVSTLFHAGEGNSPRRLALRFGDIDVPPGATIRSAKLTLAGATAGDADDDPDDWSTADEEDVPDDPMASGMSSAGGEPDLGGAGPVYAVNVAAEKTAAPASYAAAALDGRALTDAFVAWEGPSEESGTSLVSPELADIVAEVVALDGWRAGGDLSLVLAAPDGQRDAADNVRRVLSASGARPPELKIVWEPAVGDEEVVEETQTAGIRFRAVHVPPGATIKSAEIRFHASGIAEEATLLDISGELAGASEVFRDRLNDIGGRPRTSARVPWQVEPWTSPDGEYASADIARVVQEITDGSSWCGGNPMTLFLKGSGFREAVSFDGNPVKAPTLRITYAPDSVPSGAYCSNTSVVASISNGSDDAVENVASGAVSLDGDTLSSDAGGGAQAIGLRFRGLRVPQGARLVSASIELTTDVDIADRHKLDIAVERHVDPAPFYATSGNLGARDWSAASGWESTPPVAAGEGTFSEDVTDLLETVIGDPTWQAGNAVAFRLRSVGAAGSRTFRAFESGESTAARLVVYFESEREEPGTRFRDNLKREVDSLVASGATPIVSSLYEAARYYRGEGVDFGRRRGAQSWPDRFHRVSHPSSYDGGTVARPVGCSDADLDSPDCIDETIDGGTGTSAAYVSPMSSECQSNHVVLLSDGAATSNRAVERIEQMIGRSCAANPDRPSETCGPELAAWLAATDHSGAVTGRQHITLHTIAFNVDGAPRDFLERLAHEGGGSAHEAASAADLLDAFKSIFENVSKSDTSFVAPTTTISSGNRLKNRNDVYYTVFKPALTARWGGNLKRYFLAGGVGQDARVVDANGQDAFDPDTATLLPSARSDWSSGIDGDRVLEGGAAERLERADASHLARKVYTFTGEDAALDAPSNALLPGNPALERTWFDLPPNQADDDAYYETLVDWTRGRDVRDIDGDGDTLEPRGQMGDPLHAQPAVLTYANGDSVVFVATNEGFLHAFDTETGDERFAFMPRELLKNVRHLYGGTPARARPYGLDGPLTIWIDEGDPADGDGADGLVGAGERAYLYIGMRRGGDRYYALDVTDPDAPRYLWSVQGGQTTLDADPFTADGDFEELGQSWSRPVRTRVLVGGSPRDVLVFSAGYDPNQDPAIDAGSEDGDDAAAGDAARRVDGIGRGLFVVDARTGARLWQTNRNDPRLAKMSYSMPSDVRVIDINLDGMADQLYVGDTGGQLWRFDIDNASGTNARVAGGLIAELAGDDPADARRFYHPPDVALISVDGRQELAINIGSGWRAHPLDTGVRDRFYSIRSPHVYGPPVDSSGVPSYFAVKEESFAFANVTDQVGTSTADTRRGWYLELGGEGEKVLAPSITFDGQVVFSSYLPTADVDACSAALLGVNRLYRVNVLNGDPVQSGSTGGTDPSVTTDRWRPLAQSGIPPQPRILFPEAGRATVVIGNETLEEVDVELRRRTFWQELLEEEVTVAGDDL